MVYKATQDHTRLFGTSGVRGIIGPQVCLTEDLEPNRMVITGAVRKVTGNQSGVNQEATQKANERMRGLRCVE